MEKKIYILRKVLSLLLIIVLIFCVFKLFIFYIPFVISYIISSLLSPIIDKLTSRTKMTRKISSIFVLTAFFLITILIISLGITKIVEEASSFSGTLSTYIENISDFFNSLDNNKFLKEYVFINESTKNVIMRNINDIFIDFENIVKDKITNFVSSLKILPIFFINLIITILSLYFLLTDKFSILDKLEFQFSKKIVYKVKEKLEKITSALISYVKAEIILVLISFTIVLIGLNIYKIIGMDVKYPLLYASIIGIVDALPILGSGVIMIPWSIALFINKDTSLGFSILGLYLVVLCLKQMLEPKIVSNKIGVHPLFTLITMYTGFKLLGFIGIIVGPIILIIFKVVFENLLDKGLINYIRDY